MTEAYIRILNSMRDSQDLARTDADFLDRQIKIECAGLDLLKGKEALQVGDSELAARHLASANAHFHRLRIGISVFFLRAAPRLFMSSYRRLVG
jgi:hypothetical protein